MVSRLYPAAGLDPGITPSFGGWNSTTGALRRKMITTKNAATETVSALSITSGAGNKSAGFQCISPPLDGAQTISGTFSAMGRGRELATTDNVDRRWRVIRVFSGDGSTLRGTLLTLAIAAPTTEIGTALENHLYGNATALSSVSAQDGDVIVYEYGYGLSATGTSPQFDSIIGGSGTDIAAGTDKTATGTVPWIEFSQDLVFKPTLESHLSEGSGTRSFPEAVTPTAGGKLVVAVIAEGGTVVGNVTPSGGGLTWSKQVEQGSGDSNHTLIQLWTADTAGTTPVTVTMTPSGGSIPTSANYATHVWADPGTGIGGTVSGNAQTASETRSGANSHTYIAVGDWSTGAIGSPTWTPDGVTIPQSQQGASATYVFGTDQDTGAAGTDTTGISSPSYTTPSIAIIELTQGAGSTPVAASDTGTLSEGASAITATVAAADTGTLGEGAGGTSTATVSAADTATLTDANAGIALSTSDSATLSEGPLSMAVSTSDSATMTDSITGQTSPTVTDSASLSEASSVTQIGTNPTASDSFALAEAATVSAALSASDAATLAEAAAITAAVAGSDSAALSEAAGVGLSATAVDTLTFVEALAAVVPFVPPPTALGALDDLIWAWFTSRVTGPTSADAMRAYFVPRSGIPANRALADHMVAYYAAALGVPSPEDVALTTLEISFWESVDPTNNTGSWAVRAQKFYGGT